MTKKEARKAAQDLIMRQLSKIGYGEAWQQFADNVPGGEAEAELIMIQQMNRVAKLMGYEKAWFS